MDGENEQTTTEEVQENQQNEQTPPSSDAPSAPSIDPNALRAELDRLGRQALSEQAGRISQLERELAEARNTRPAPEAQDPARFFENPRQIIREELQQVVAPLLNFQRSYEQESEYTKLKRQALASPQLGHLLKDVESVVDQMMDGQQPTAQNLQAAIFTALGLKSANMLPTAPNPAPYAPPPPAPGNIVTNPPYIPPSPPPAPRTGPKPNQGPVLTEAERQIAKQWNMSPEEYVQLRDADSDVSSWPREAKK